MISGLYWNEKSLATPFNILVFQTPYPTQWRNPNKWGKRQKFRYYNGIVSPSALWNLLKRLQELRMNFQYENRKSSKSLITRHMVDQKCCHRMPLRCLLQRRNYQRRKKCNKKNLNSISWMKMNWGTLIFRYLYSSRISYCIYRIYSEH